VVKAIGGKSIVATANHRSRLSVTTPQPNDFATITGRIGYILLPQTLLYVQGGWAHTHDHLDVTIPTVGFLSEFAGVDFSGWTVGGGIEWAVTPYLSLFPEYNYLGFDTKTVTFTIGPTAVPPGPDIINHTQNLQTAGHQFVALRLCGRQG
jgi:outer membrane immunogenic protein